MKKKFDLEKLGAAELVVTDGERYALAVVYAIGSTPHVVALTRSVADWKELCWSAQELNVPMVETPRLDREALAEVKLDEAIPNSLYDLVAQGLASLMRYREIPIPVRYYRPLTKAPSTLRKRVGGKVADLSERLRSSRFTLRAGFGLQDQDWVTHLRMISERVAIQLGFPLPEGRVEWSEALEPGHVELWIDGVLRAAFPVEVSAEGTTAVRKIYDILETQVHLMLGFRETEELLARLKKDHPSLYKELFPKRLDLALMRQILRNLLRERVSIADLRGILESLVSYCGQTEDAELLTELVRSDLRQQLSTRFGDRAGRIHALMFEPQAEKGLLRALRGQQGRRPEIDLDGSLAILTSVARTLESGNFESTPVVILCNPRIRRFLSRLLEPSFPFLPVLSYTEVAPLTDVITVGMVGR